MNNTIYGGTTTTPIPLNNGCSIVELKTGLRSYSSNHWATMEAYDYEDYWNSVSNTTDLKIGDIGVLRGKNTTTGLEVLLFGEITKIEGNKVWTKTKAIIQGSKGDTGPQGPEGPQGPQGAQGPKGDSDGFSIVILQTGLREYSNVQWAQYATYDTEEVWNSVTNTSDLKIGDVAILRGKNTTTGADVLLFGKVCDINGTRVTTKTNALLQGIQGPEKEAKYIRYRDQAVKFELKKGRMYSFTVDNDDVNSASIVDRDGNTVAGVAGKSLTGLKNGMIICAERCTAMGLTGELSLLNSTAYVNDRWDWMDGYKEQYGPYYLKTTTTDGIDIWEY